MERILDFSRLCPFCGKRLEYLGLAGAYGCNCKESNYYAKLLYEKREIEKELAEKEIEIKKYLDSTIRGKKVKEYKAKLDDVYSTYEDPDNIIILKYSEDKNGDGGDG